MSARLCGLSVHHLPLVARLRRGTEGDAPVRPPLVEPGLVPEPGFFQPRRRCPVTAPVWSLPARIANAIRPRRQMAPECDARAALPLAWFRGLLRGSGDFLSGAAGASWLGWLGWGGAGCVGLFRVVRVRQLTSAMEETKRGRVTMAKFQVRSPTPSQSVKEAYGMESSIRTTVSPPAICGKTSEAISPAG